MIRSVLDAAAGDLTSSGGTKGHAHIPVPQNDPVRPKPVKEREIVSSQPAQMAPIDSSVSSLQLSLVLRGRTSAAFLAKQEEVRNDPSCI